MANLSTKYLGLDLRNPIIVGSSGLTDSVEDIKELEKFGAGAVVLKSIFEEEILHEMEYEIAGAEKEGYDSGAFDYYDYKIKEKNLSAYVKLIEETKKSVSIPVIASINCVSAHEWMYYAQKFETAGADALELNVFVLPTNFNKTAEENEQVYFDLANKVKDRVKIPVALKISHYSSNLGPFIQTLSETGIDGLVLFNRFWSPDFDIENFQLTSSHVLSRADELSISLRWVAIMSERVKCDLSASTGVHDSGAVIKQLLAGANSVQVVSALYKNNKSYLQDMLSELESWMERHGFASIDEFRGKMSQSKSEDPAVYERVQFMRYFRGQE